MFRGSLAAIVIALAVPHAHAQAPAPNPAADAALTEGRRLYDLQEWDKAIAKFKEAYTLREDAPALFNIAQSYRLKGDCAQAASFYKTFKRKFPAERNIAAVDKFITEMEACAKAKPAPVEPVPTPAPTPVEPAPTVTPPPPVASEPAPAPILPPPERSGGGGLRIASYVAMGAGGVGIALGVVFGVKAMDAASEAEALADDAEWKPDIQKRGLRHQRNSRIGFVGGGVVAAAGIVMFVLSRESSPERNTVTVVPTDEGAAFVWAGSF